MIKVFGIKTEYNDFTNGGTEIKSGVLYYIKENGEVHFTTNNIDGQMKHYDMLPSVEFYRNQYCTIEALESGILYIWGNSYTDPLDDLYYSLDEGTTWQNLRPQMQVNLHAGVKCLLKKTTPWTYEYKSKIKFSGKFYISGNLLSLCNGDDFRTDKTLHKGCFCGMFGSNDKLISVKNLVLEGGNFVPVLCYADLFNNCTSLMDSPIILNKKATLGAYRYMFAGCTSLTTAPDLSNIEEFVETDTTIEQNGQQTTIDEGAFYSMFADCTNLTTAPELPCKKLALRCYREMFRGCTSLTTAPKLPATTLAQNCYRQMFDGCTSLTTAPELPSTTLAQSCYVLMFRGCTSLTTAPKLPATTLTIYCYQGMFLNCTNLVNTPELPAITLVQQCYDQLFSGCSKIKVVKAYFENGLNVTKVLNKWLQNVASEGTIYLKEGVSLPEGINGIPTGWTVKIIND